MNRRTFIQAFSSIVGALSLPLAGKAFAIKRVPIDVTGKPTPIELIKGVPGYFIAAHPDPLIGGDRLEFGTLNDAYLDGVCVTSRTSEIDLTAGWARMYDVETNQYGSIVLQHCPKRLVSIERIHFGHVEIR